ncbi:hypothetical protein BR93DRAFT_972257 [Coniochaeta sp. PMI_546]|nr:hypothetical protein BR93DRAFT_972257 [Coniochaeta sp. PMI_546]
MAPGQRTFTIVPNPLGMQGLVQRPAGEGVPNHRPMTSKQAQKLHRQATRLPKRTKAEQAEYEREQKRLIKEEDEKRRASNKARMLRERKKEKEQNLIEAKKRKGLPIVDVRPSQDLITRFVRGNGTDKKRHVSGAPVRLEAVREESPACDSATETAADEDVYHPADEKAEGSDDHVQAPETPAEPSSNPAKRLRKDLNEAGKPSVCAVQSPRPSQRASRTAVSALRMLDARSRESSLDVDDPAVEDLLRTQILEESVSAANSSTIQQRSPAQSVDITSRPELPLGKENIPPVSSAVDTTQRWVNKSLPKWAQVQPPMQPSSPMDVTAISPRSNARRCHIQEPDNYKGPPVPGLSPPLPTTQSSVVKSPQAQTSVQRRHTRDTVSAAPKSSSYATDLIEGIMCQTPIGAATVNTRGAIKGANQQECPEPRVSRAPGLMIGTSAKGESRGPRFHPSAERQPFQNATTNVRKSATNGTNPRDALTPGPPKVSFTRSLAAVDQNVMPPPPAPSNRFKRPAQESVGPKFLSKHLQSPQPRPPLANPGHKAGQELGSIARESVLPSSTQLFVLSHLEDILPSPSQELRELQDTTPPRQATSRPQPSFWKPPPRFPASSIRTLHRLSPHPPQQLKAPRPGQPTTTVAPVLQIRQTIEPAFPFFSTQDLMLSSQDIRDLEDGTDTPSKLPSKESHSKPSHTTAVSQWREPPPRPEQSRVDDFIYPWKLAGQGRAEVVAQRLTVSPELQGHSQHPQASRYARQKSQPRTPVCSSDPSAKASQFQVSQPQSSSLNPARSNPSLAHVGSVSQRSLRSSPRAQSCNTQVAEVASQNHASSKPSASARNRPSLSSYDKENQQGSGNNSQTDKEEPHVLVGSPNHRSPKPSASPQKGRFFTASNEAIQLAMEKSMRTHREEQRRREAEQRALELLRQEVSQAEGDDEQEDVEEKNDEVEDDAAALRKVREVEEDEEVDLLDELGWDIETEMEEQLLIEEREDKREATRDIFELEDDLDEELLAAEYDMVDIQPPPCVLLGPGAAGFEQEEPGAGAVVASQETDYGDLDVTVEDLGDYL